MKSREKISIIDSKVMQVGKFERHNNVLPKQYYGWFYVNDRYAVFAIYIIILTTFTLLAL